VAGRIYQIVSRSWTSSSAPTAPQRRSYEIAAEEFDKVLSELRRLVEEDLASIEAELEAAGAPWTPGRLPRWEKE
jgi:hypothetical protein